MAVRLNSGNAVGGLIFAIVDEPDAVGAANKRPVISDLSRRAIELWHTRNFFSSDFSKPFRVSFAKHPAASLRIN
jgi:hypothetical protein